MADSLNGGDVTNAFDRSAYPTCEPDTLTIGDRWAWRRLLSLYPATAYTLSYAARSQAQNPTHFPITASAEGSDHIVEVSATTTDDYEPGVYAWTAYITRNSDSERLTLGAGVWVVDPDRATSGADPRTFAQQQIDKLKVVLAALNAQQASGYSTGDRSVTRRDPESVRRELAYWETRRRQEVHAERLARGERVPTSIRARFNG